MTLIGPRGWTPATVSHRLSTSAPSSYDPETHTCMACISTGAAVDRIFGCEILEISQDAVDLSRIPVPLLDSHSQASVSDVLGRIDAARIRDGELLARLAFAQTPRGRLAEGMLARGEISGISAGYKVLRWSVVDADGDPVDPSRASWADDLTYTATRWQLLEASLVGVPADAMAAVRNLGGGEDHANIIARMKTRERMYARQRMHNALQAATFGARDE